MITFFCPSCSQKFEADDGLVGQTSTCDCGAEVTVPKLPPTIKKASPSSASTSRDIPFGVVFLTTLKVIISAVIILIGPFLLLTFGLASCGLLLSGK